MPMWRRWTPTLCLDVSRTQPLWPRGIPWPLLYVSTERTGPRLRGDVAAGRAGCRPTTRLLLARRRSLAAWSSRLARCTAWSNVAKLAVTCWW